MERIYGCRDVVVARVIGMAEVISSTEQGGNTTLTPPGNPFDVVFLGQRDRMCRAVQLEFAITTSTLAPHDWYINANIFQYDFFALDFGVALSVGRESSISVEMVG